MSDRCVALFCGGRNWKWADAGVIGADIDSLPPWAVVVVGEARGADQIARERAEERGLHLAVVRARWDLFGKHAGPLRNDAMLALCPTVGYAYPTAESRGTWDMVRKLRNAAVETFVRHEVLAP